MANEPKNFLIGVTGCIAAYKSCQIVRELQKAGHNVKVVMTEHATRFVDPVTFRALTHEKVAVGLFDDPTDPIHHISLAEWADVFLVAPCTANVLAKIACGIADDLLTTTALATTAPLVLAPAMNVHMYENPVTQENMQRLAQRGVTVIGADSGFLACGDVGAGRLPEPEQLARTVMGLADGEGACVGCGAGHEQDLAGLHVLVTAGPTVEPIDPVRYITNRSSGKFGYAIAQAASSRGAQVTLVSGPVALPAPKGVEVRSVQSARDMLAAAQDGFENIDIVLCAAAVADFRPVQEADQKLKKGVNDEALSCIQLVQNPDILSTLGHSKAAGQVVVGFAAETNNAVENAKGKLERKAADMIVANEVYSDKTFGDDDDTIWMVTAEGVSEPATNSKAKLAHIILDKALELRG